MVSCRFPTVSETKSLWIRNIRREERFFQPSESSVVCSLHFNESDVHRGSNRTILAPGAVPINFNLPFRLMKEDKYRSYKRSAEAEETQEKTNLGVPHCGREHLLNSVADHSYAVPCKKALILQRNELRSAVESKCRKIRQVHKRKRILQAKVISSDALASCNHNDCWRAMRYYK